MNEVSFNLLLADDDQDDCIFFSEALLELPVATTLTTANDGVELMDLLSARLDNPPDIIFLDLNMPKKTGFDCLLEIKGSEKLKRIPVIIFSTSLNPDMATSLYEKGASFYIRKPSDFAALKKIIYQVILLAAQNNLVQPSKDSFLIQL